MPDLQPPRAVAHVMGGFDVAVDGRHLGHADWQRHSAERLVKLLLVTDGHTVSREVAAETLWPDASPDAGRASLRKAIHFARHALSVPGTLTTDADHIRLDPSTMDIDLDRLLDAFLVLDGSGPHTLESPAASAGAAGAFSAALATVLELGPRTLLPDDAYEDWLVAPRERLGSRWLVVALEAAQEAIASGRSAEAHRLLEQALERDPTDEAAHRLAIGLYAAEGRHHAARRQFDLCRRALLDGLDAQPSEDTVAAFTRAERGAGRVTGPGSAAARLVGRHRELEAVEAVLDRVAAGRSGSVVIRGSPGIGKTRLLDEVREYARGAGWREIAWQASESTHAFAFAPFAIRLAGIVRPEEVDGWGEPERSGISTVVPGLGLHPLLPFAQRDALVVALIGALARIARDGPLLIALDDCGWLDDASLALLEGVVTALADLPILVGVTYRDGEPVGEAFETLLVRLHRNGALDLRLDPLVERDIEPLVLGHLGGASVTPAVRDALFAQSDGNPLFCLEIARAARAAGTLGLEQDRWTLKVGATLDDPPESVRQVVAFRLHALPPPAAELLRIAAQLGTEFRYETLVAVAPDPQHGLMSALDTALASGLLIERGGGYAFAHPLFRTAIESAAGVARRGEMHLRIARALAGELADPGPIGLEAVAGTCTDPLPVAEHALRAFELGQQDAGPLAVAFGFAAGARSRRLFDMRAASPMFERSIAVWERLPTDEARVHDASGAFVALAELRMTMGDEPAAETAFRAAATVARTPDELAVAYDRFGWLPYRHGDFQGAIALCEEALARLPSDALAPRALVQATIGWCLGRLHRLDEAVASLEACVTALERAGDLHQLGPVLDRLGMMLPFVGRHADAVAALQRSLAIALDLRDARGELVRIHLGATLTRIGRPAQARPHAARALELTVLMGDRYLEAVASWMAAEMEDALGDAAAARAMRERELRLLAGIGGNAHNEALAHAHLAHLAQRAGDALTAAREAEQARALAATDPEPGYAARIDAALAVASWSELQTG